MSEVLFRQVIEEVEKRNYSNVKEFYQTYGEDCIDAATIFKVFLDNYFNYIFDDHSQKILDTLAYDCGISFYSRPEIQCLPDKVREEISNNLPYPWRNRPIRNLPNNGWDPNIGWDCSGF